MCKSQVKGFSNAQFKGFVGLSEAQEYMGDAAPAYIRHQSVPPVAQLALQRRTPGIIKHERSARSSAQLPLQQQISRQHFMSAASVHEMHGEPVQIIPEDLYRLVISPIAVCYELCQYAMHLISKMHAAMWHFGTKHTMTWDQSTLDQRHAEKY